MILGMIIDVGAGNAPGTTAFNGASIQHFYSWVECLEWARLTSTSFDVGPGGQMNVTCMVVNTDLGVRYIYIDGTQYTP